MACSECFSNVGHKFDCSRHSESGFMGSDEVKESRISGYAREAVKGYGSSSLEEAYFDVPVVTHIEGNLYSGGTIAGYPLDHDFVKVVSLYPWESHSYGPDTERVEIEMLDVAGGAGWDDVIRAAEEVEQGLTRGKVLVCCQAGLNRSGLVTAQVLIRAGRTPDEAIALLREKRHQLVLCNNSFVNMLKENYAQALYESQA